MERKSFDIIKEITKEFFEKINFELEIEFVPPVEDTVSINIKTQEPQTLIGEGGQTLSDIQHILKAILRKKIAEPFFISVDINEYRKRKEEYLKETARSYADEVFLTKKEKELAPMPAYERRVVHMELVKREDVVSESVGEGLERRVIIKPRS
jgi:spoIIIJ-associated protein